MAHVLECGNGHHWGSPTSVEQTARCPVCGAPAVVPVPAGEPTRPPHDSPPLHANGAPEPTLSDRADDTLNGKAPAPVSSDATHVIPGEGTRRVEAVDDHTLIEPAAAAGAEETLVQPPSKAEVADEDDGTLELAAPMVPEGLVETNLNLPSDPYGQHPSSTLEPTVSIDPRDPRAANTSGDTTFLPGEGSQLHTTQFNPPPSVGHKPPHDSECTTLFSPDSTEHQAPSEETALLTGESPRSGGTAAPSETAFLDSSAPPSAAEPTALFDTATGSASGGDATNVFDSGTLESKSNRPKSRARLGLKELSGFEIISELGRGGMGVVYKARQKGIGRIVALKRILSNDIGANDVVRFRIEAEAVGELQHPNIVQIYELGEDKGKPWCALEYLDGGSLHGKLKGEPQPVRWIAEILEPICRALHACHQKKIIHRDIKPANILLAADGTPKLTDFGLAKKLDDDVGQTRSGTILGTPSYMAPEQAEGKVKELGPTADIYSVGAMMYEMITGRPPLKGETVIDTLLLVQSTDPLAPSVLIPKVPRDLETICMKCLQKAPDKRYASAGALADDLRRFLDGEPISARPASSWEKAAKWVRRNKLKAVSLASVATIFVGLLVSSVIIAKQESDKADLASAKVIAESERADTEERLKQEAARGESREREFGKKLGKEKDRAEGSYHVAREAVDEMLTRVGRERLAHQPHMEQIRRSLLQSALKFYEWLRGYAGNDPDLRFENARAYVRVGDIREMLGERTEAEKSYLSAQTTLEGLAKEYPGNPRYQRELANCLNNLGNLRKRFNDQESAEAALTQAAVLREKLEKWQRDTFTFGLPGSLVGLAAGDGNLLSLLAAAGIPRDDPDYAADLASTWTNLGVLAYGRNQFKEADAYYRKALDVFDRLASAYPKTEHYRLEQALCYDNLGELLAKLGRPKDANRALAEARESLLQLVETGKNDPSAYRQELAKCYDHLGNLLRDTDPKRAQQLYKNSLALRVGLVEQFPDMLDYRQEMATSLNNIAIAMLAAGDAAHAHQAFDEALQYQERLVSLTPLDKDFRRELASSYANAAIFLQQKNVFQDAEKYYGQSIQHLDQLVKRDPTVPDYLRDAATVWQNLSVLQLQQRQANQALESARKSLDLRERLARQWPQVPIYQQDLAQGCKNLGTLLQLQNKPADAERSYHRATDILTHLVQKYGNNPDYRFELAMTSSSLADVLKTPSPTVYNPVAANPWGWVGLGAVPAGRRVQAEQAWRTAVDQLTQLSKTYPTIPAYQKECARSMAALAQYLDTTTNFPEAEQRWQLALRLANDLRTRFPDQPAYALELAQTLGKRGFSYLIANRPQRAREPLFEAIDLLTALIAQDSRVPEYYAELLLDYENLARSLKLLDLLPDVENIRKQMVSLREKQLATFPGVAEHACGFGANLIDLAAVQSQRGKVAEAEKTYERAVQQLRAASAKKVVADACRPQLTRAYLGLAGTQLERGHHGDAALAMDELAGLAPLPAEEGVAVAGILARCADVVLTDNLTAVEKRRDMARRYGDRAMEALRKAIGQGYRDVDYLKQAVALAPVRSRPDFRQLLVDMTRH